MSGRCIKSPRRRHNKMRTAQTANRPPAPPPATVFNDVSLQGTGQPVDYYYYSPKDDPITEGAVFSSWNEVYQAVDEHSQKLGLSFWHATEKIGGTMGDGNLGIRMTFVCIRWQMGIGCPAMIQFEGYEEGGGIHLTSLNRHHIHPQSSSDPDQTVPMHASDHGQEYESVSTSDDEDSVVINNNTSRQSEEGEATSSGLWNQGHSSSGESEVNDDVDTTPTEGRITSSPTSGINQASGAQSVVVEVCRDILDTVNKMVSDQASLRKFTESINVKVSKMSDSVEQLCEIVANHTESTCPKIDPDSTPDKRQPPSKDRKSRSQATLPSPSAPPPMQSTPTSKVQTTPTQPAPPTSMVQTTPAQPAPPTSKVQTPPTQPPPPTSKVQTPQTQPAPPTPKVQTPQTQQAPTLKVQTPPTQPAPPTPKVQTPLTQQAPTSKVQTPQTQQAPTLKVQTPPTQQAPTSKVQTPQTQQAPTLKVETPQTQQAPTSNVQTIPTQQAPTSKVETPPTQQAPTLKVQTPQTQQAPTLKVETPPTQPAPPTSKVQTPQTQPAPPTPKVQTPQTQQAPTSNAQTTPTQQAPTSKVQTTPTQPPPPTSNVQTIPTQQAPTSNAQTIPTQQAPTSNVQTPPTQQAPTSKVETPPTQQAPTSKVQTTPTQQATTPKVETPPTQLALTSKSKVHTPPTQQAPTSKVQTIPAQPPPPTSKVHTPPTEQAPTSKVQTPPTQPPPPTPTTIQPPSTQPPSLYEPAPPPSTSKSAGSSEDGEGTSSVDAATYLRSIDPGLKAIAQLNLHKRLNGNFRYSKFEALGISQSVTKGFASRLGNYELLFSFCDFLDPDSGIFVIPVNGRYRFEVTYKQLRHGKGRVYLARDDGERHVIGKFPVDGDGDSTAAVEWTCNQGSLVWVEAIRLSGGGVKLKWLKFKGEYFE